MIIIISDKVKNAAPDLVILKFEADIVNGPSSSELMGEIVSEGQIIKSKYEISDINKRIAIAATRAAYKVLGKEPNRYRPSAEALCRRMVQGKGLYSVNAAVDAINLISMHTGHSIGGFDIDKIEGERLILGVGNSEEKFHAIGRGLLNIESLPVYRDAVGAIGSPTSDCDRTKLTDSTRRLLMIVNIYGMDDTLGSVRDYCVSILKKYCGAGNISISVIRPE